MEAELQGGSGPPPGQHSDVRETLQCGEDGLLVYFDFGRERLDRPPRITLDPQADQRLELFIALDVVA